MHFLADQKNCISIDLRGAQVTQVNDRSAVCHVSSHAHSIVLLYSVGNKITATATNRLENGGHVFSVSLC